MKKKYILCFDDLARDIAHILVPDDEVVRMSDKKVAFMQEEIAVTRAGGDVIAPHGVESNRLDTRSCQ